MAKRRWPSPNAAQEDEIKEKDLPPLEKACV